MTKTARNSLMTMLAAIALAAGDARVVGVAGGASQKSA